MEDTWLKSNNHFLFFESTTFLITKVSISELGKFSIFSSTFQFYRIGFIYKYCKLSHSHFIQQLLFTSKTLYICPVSAISGQLYTEQHSLFTRWSNQKFFYHNSLKLNEISYNDKTKLVHNSSYVMNFSYIYFYQGREVILVT